MNTACILLIDDHVIVLDGLRMVLESALSEVRVLTATTINAAMQIEIAPELVLLDIKLSGINGLDGMALLKRKWPQARIAMLSSQDDGETRRQALERGADAFVSKAEAAEQVVKIVTKLREGQALSTAIPANPAPQYLTPRQCEVLDLLNTGLTNKSIAKQLGLSGNTVRRHVQDIFAYFSVATRTEAIFAARSQGILN